MSQSDLMSPELHCSPKEIYFKSLAQGERQRSSLTLYNPTSQRFAFKVKTTNRQSYVVKPSVGFLEPDSTFKIVIIKQRNPTKNGPDKFLIEAQPTDAKTSNATDVKASNGNKNVKLIKVPVLLEPETNTSSENNNSRDALLAQASFKTEESFLPTPESSRNQAPSRVSSSNNVEEIRSTTAARDGLICMNDNITFKYNAGSTVMSHIRIYNPTLDRYAFKIRNTFPKGFRVKPPQGFVKPHTAVDIEVVLLNSWGVDFTFSKFLIQSFVVDFTDEVITESMYHKAKLYKAVREIELDVKLVGFTEQADTESTISVDPERNAAAAYEIRYLRKQLMQMEGELNSLKEQVKDQRQSFDNGHRRNDSLETSQQCVGCMHAPPIFQFRRNRRSYRTV